MINLQLPSYYFWWTILRQTTPLPIGFRPHLQFQRTTFHNVGMIQVVFEIRLSVQCSTLDLDILLRSPSSLNSKRPASFRTERNGWKRRTRQHIIGRPRTNRIETHSCKHIPSRHLSCIIVSGQSTRGIMIFRIHNMADNPLRFPWLPSIVKHESYLMARFIAMPVTALRKH